MASFIMCTNRGTDKRTIFEDDEDILRFYESMKDFNAEDPIGSMYEYGFIKKQLGSLASKSHKKKPLVRFVAYCLNPNHFHFLLEQVADDGISKFMHRLSTGYTKYFNKKYKRTGSLFSGSYKAIHVDTNEYLLRLSAYVNLNDRVHGIGIEEKKYDFAKYSSWGEYMNENIGGTLCDKGVVTEQFRSTGEYAEFAKEALGQILENKAREKELKNMLME